MIYGEEWQRNGLKNQLTLTETPSTWLLDMEGSSVTKLVC